MRYLPTLLVPLGMLALCSCAPRAPHRPETYVRETSKSFLARYKGPAAPLPRKTPYDGDASARAMYLDWYQAGYRSGLTGLRHNMCYVPGPYPRAQQQGWSDGQLVGNMVWFEKTLKPMVGLKAGTKH